eukprot:CAMPEP_0202916692 /NCGR_PEP_ID=MMETSP1392-20130828/69220_1 /ASSEMBLY_ACC=CAM_ASM_000868 /TAXON_ID=225041 /ORGANISM="Chlamydomonas chlamydogama, Strain SAG 11-48b" /LENGTH=88 /DNA_ID=CAMNT_0049609211 /DNA_START=1215 /DNA_END=1482 /DNA_ORIENTATION=-
MAAPALPYIQRISCGLIVQTPRRIKPATLAGCWQAYSRAKVTPQEPPSISHWDMPDADAAAQNRPPKPVWSSPQDILGGLIGHNHADQ